MLIVHEIPKEISMLNTYLGIAFLVFMSLLIAIISKRYIDKITRYAYLPMVFYICTNVLRTS